MGVSFLTPLAWIGLIGIALPIAVHLLVRHQSREVPFPSLRFLVPTKLSAIKRRRIQDWPLLLVRLAAVLMAVAAAAGPLVITPARQLAWDARTARAVVLSGTPASAVDEERSAFRFREFTSEGRTGDALRAALAWLELQPPAAREIVVAGDLRAGMLSDADVSALPPGVGLRFLPAPDESGARRPTWAVMGNGNAVDVALAEDATAVTYSASAAAAGQHGGLIEVRAPADEQSIAAAALREALARQPLVPTGAARRVLIEWTRDPLPDAGPLHEPWMQAAAERLPPGLVLEARDQRLAIVAAGPVVLDDARRLIQGVVDAVRQRDLTPFEPARISAAQLAAWSRPSGPAPDQAPREDEGDRRWIWAGVLGLLTLEWWMRRERPGAL